MLNIRPPQPNLAQRSIIRFGSTPPGRWLFSHTLHHLDALVHAASSGRVSATQLVSDLPIIALTAVGAKSGQSRTVPLITVPDGESLLLVASNWGRRPLPAWYYNLKANPAATVDFNGRSQAVVARELAGAERDVAWVSAVKVYPGYDAYAHMLKGIRDIPMLRLEAAD